VYVNLSIQNYYRNKGRGIKYLLTEMIFCVILTGFSYFPLEKKNPKVAGRGLNRSEMEVLKEGLDGFSYFV
jgi:hypothetical protein